MEANRKVKCAAFYRKKLEAKEAELKEALDKIDRLNYLLERKKYTGGPVYIPSEAFKTNHEPN